MCKNVAMVIWILGGIGSVILGQVFQTTGRYSWDTSYNIVVCLTSMVMIFIQGSLFWGIGEIVEKLTEANSYLRVLKQHTKNDVIQAEELKVATKPNTNEHDNLMIVDGEWICEGCNHSNDMAYVFCEKCAMRR